MNNYSPSINLYGSRKYESGVTFFLLIYLTLCFFSQASEVTIREVVVGHVNVNPLYLIIGISALFVITALLKARINIDRITFALLLCGTFSLIPLTYASNMNSYWGNYLPILVSVSSYYVCVQSNSDVSTKIYNIMCLVCAVVSIQVILTELHYFSSLSFSNFSNLTIKGLMNLPIGSSNLISATLLPLLVYIITFKRGKLTFAISGLTLYALILCRSKNAISVAILFISFVVVRKVYRFIINDRSVDRKTKIIILLIITVVFGLISGLIYLFLENVIIALQFTSYGSSYSDPLLNFFDRVTSGRLEIFENELARATQHLFFGNGFGYDFGQAKSHNWIIDLLVQRGVIGFGFYMFCISSVIKSGLKHYKSDKFTRSCINLLLIVFIQGLFEITLFTTGIDFLVWSIAGFLIARSRALQKNV